MRIQSFQVLKTPVRNWQSCYRWLWKMCQPLRQTPACVMGQSSCLSLFWSFLINFLNEGDASSFLEGPFAFFLSSSSSALLSVSKACCLPHHLVGQRVWEKEGISRRGILWYSTPLNYLLIKSEGRCGDLLSCHMEARLPLETVGNDVSRGERWCSGLWGPELVFSDNAVMS